MKKIFYSILSVLFSLQLLFILLISSFEAVCYWMPGYYEQEFRKYQVAEEMAAWTGEKISYESLDEVIRQTMRYLRGERENLIVPVEINGREQEFYNENEKGHMADVRLFFLRSITLRALACLNCLALLAFLIILEHHRALAILGGGFLRTGAVLLLLALLLGAVTASDFTRYFTIFHEILFRQGNWLFDPRQSRMINMLPEGFFSDTALRILLVFLASTALFGFVGFIASRRK